MASLKTKRVLATVAVTVAAGVLPLVAAAPAHADLADCAAYLHHRDYVVGPKVKHACGWPATHAPAPWGDIPSPQCLVELKAINVKEAHAVAACKRA